MAHANGLYLGPVPDERQGLTVVKEAAISRCRAKVWVIQLPGDDLDTPPNGPAERGLKGNIVIHPQRPGK